MTIDRFLYILGIAAIPVTARLWVTYRRSKRAARESVLPLFDAVALEIAMTPQPGDNDDPDVLAEMRETLTHLNQRTHAATFWTLDKQLAEYYARVPEKSRMTVRRAVLRLIASPDRWLQTVGVKTAAALSFREARPAAESLLASLADASGPDERFRAEVEAALARL